MEPVNINKVIEELSQLQQSNIATRVEELLKKLFKDGCGFVIFDLHQGKQIIRSRVNTCEKSFFSKCELTYAPPHLNKTYQRASTPNQTMFYGTVMRDNQKSIREAQLISLAENCKWLKDENLNGFQVVTSGIWKVKKDISLIAVIQQNKEFENNLNFKDVIDGFKDFKKNNTEDVINKTITISTFLANEFSKPSNSEIDYLIPALFTELAIQQNGIHGVSYPSAIVKDKSCLNVAIIPEIVNDALELDYVAECSIYKNKGEIILDNEKHAKLLPNQTFFDLQPVPSESHIGRENVLKQLGINSIDNLK